MSKSVPAIRSVKARAVVVPLARPVKNAFGVIDEQRAPRLGIDQVRALDRALPGTVIRLPRAHGVRATGVPVSNGYLDVHRIA